MVDRRRWILTGGVLALVIAAALWATGEPDFEPPGTELSERIDGGFYTFVTSAGDVVTESAVVVGVGDRYIDETNRLYEVSAIKGDTVEVESQGVARMPDVSRAVRAMERALKAREERDEEKDEEKDEERESGIAGRLVGILAQAQGSDSGSVGIYHTHNDESYLPTSGADSEQYGDIHLVGEMLKKALESQGHRVIWKDDSHLPHDGQAYLRSRRTAIAISRERPKTILDVHRDAIPRKESYLTEVNGEQMTQVRVVVGRQNQNRSANLEYAKRIKAIADEKYPGLVKGIFDASGNYNQDLGPRMILLEFGTHVTSLELANRSAELMANVISAAAGLTAGAGDGGVGGAGGRTALWLVILAAAGGIGWILLNKEGLEGVKASLRRVTGRLGSDNGDDGDKGGTTS